MFQMVLPALSALLGSFEALASGSEVKVLGNLIPFSILVFAEYKAKYGQMSLRSRSYFSPHVILPLFLMIVWSWYFKK